MQNFPENQAQYWRDVELPESWPDNLSKNILRVFYKVFGKKVEKVKLPDQLPGAEKIPKYVLQEFHSLPNGNYSKKITAGYARSFDATMFNTTKHQRKAMAERFANAEVGLDLGCGGGQMANALIQAGVKEVWGIEPSPYLIQIAAKTYPELRLLQGVAEDIPLPDESVDVVSACFLFHEIPPRYSAQVLREVSRVLKPGGSLFFIEPSPTHMLQSTWQVFKSHGLKGLYFKIMAHLLNEPFIMAWHKCNVPEWLAEGGLTIYEDNDSMPLRTVLAKKK